MRAPARVMSASLSLSAIRRDAIPLNHAPLAMASKYFSALRMAEYELSVAEDRARAHGGPDAFSECMAKRTAVDRVKAQMEELVREKLVRGDAVAIGVKSGGGASGEPELIPADFWAYADIDFEGMTARYRDQRYTSIHAATYYPPRHDLPPTGDDGPDGAVDAPSGEEPLTEEASPAPAASVASKEAKRGRGRPNKRAIIRLAGQAAMERIGNFCDLPATEWAKEILDILKNDPNFEEHKHLNPHYETIRREINVLCGKGPPQK